MKKYIKSKLPTKIEIDIEAVVEFNAKDQDVAASTYKDLYVPEGELLPGEKDAIINSQAWADYCSFIESVEDLMTDYYDLHIYYKNESEDYSFYWGLLAKNDTEDILIDFNLKLRVSNHPAHRSKESQHRKAEQEAQLQKITEGKKSKPMTQIVVVNNKTFKSYMDAFMEVDRILERAVGIMKRKS